jgi:predicted secreted protein
MNSPQFKVYRASGEYVASCKYASDAGWMAAISGDGATVRYGHAKKDTLWTEGAEVTTAGKSFDHVAEIILDRYQALMDAYAAKNASKRVLHGDDAIPGLRLRKQQPTT